MGQLAAAPLMTALPLPVEAAPVAGRNWVAGSGAVLRPIRPGCPLSFEACDEVGLLKVVPDYLTERTVLAANNCTLRRVPLTVSTDWHQDVAFLGQDIPLLRRTHRLRRRRARDRPAAAAPRPHRRDGYRGAIFDLGGVTYGGRTLGGDRPGGSPHSGSAMPGCSTRCTCRHGDRHDDDASPPRDRVVVLRADVVPRRPGAGGLVRPGVVSRQRAARRLGVCR
jgi:hypothetical protein